MIESHAHGDVDLDVSPATAHPGTAKVPVTVLIHALNEEVNLPHTLRNVMDWADQVVVVDSESSDRTPDVAHSFGAELFSRACTREGLVEQRNWALDNLAIRNEWIFILDADEVMEDDLKEEVERLINEDDASRDGYWLRFKLYFMGEWMRHASMYPSWSLRLFRRGVVRYERREVNSHPMVAPGREGYLQGHVINEDRKGFAHYVQRMNEFSTLEARSYSRVLSGGHAAQKLLRGRLFGTPAERRRYLKHLFVRLPFRPLVLFLYLYFVRRGFLDGRAGFDYCVFKASIEWMISVKLREARLRA